MQCHCPDGVSVGEVKLAGVATNSGDLAMADDTNSPEVQRYPYQAGYSRCTRTFGIPHRECSNYCVEGNRFCELHMKQMTQQMVIKGGIRPPSLSFSTSDIKPPLLEKRRRSSGLGTDGVEDDRFHGEETDGVHGNSSNGEGTLGVNGDNSDGDEADGVNSDSSDGDETKDYIEQKNLQYLEQAVPKQEANATKLLAPWMGILVNIDNSRTKDVWHKERFKDLTANMGQLTQHLKDFCHLKTVKDVVEENERNHKQVVDILLKAIDIAITSNKSSPQCKRSDEA